MKPELEDTYIEYSRFNAKRSLGFEEESNFHTERRGKSVALIDPSRPAPSFSNRIFGFAPEDAGRLPDLLSLYGNGLPQIDLEPEEIDEPAVGALMSRSYRPWISLTYLKATPRPFPESEIQIERWGPEKADDFVGLLNRTMDEPFSEDIWNLRRKYYCTDSFRTFVAYLGGEPCAWATLFVHGNAGVLANAYTFENARRRGCHTALLNHRLSDAAKLGLANVFTDVVPETDSHQNCRRAGFEHVTTNTLWHPNSP